MDIVILGAGAIGSLFGALLSKNNKVLLVGRTPHITTIRNHGLKITGKTQMHVKIPAVDSIEKSDASPDLLMVTVKSYDTETALREAQSIMHNHTIVLSLQNGLDNIDKIEKVVDRNHILGGVTTHGAFLSKPGVIEHTGKGQTIVGELSGQKTERLTRIVATFTEAGIETGCSTDLMKEMWIKAIINSSINPLTTLLSCTNGYLVENPVLEKMVERVCKESTAVAKAHGITLSYQSMVRRTKEVIHATADNYSSMLQSIQRGKKTEIDSINGIIVKLGKKQGIDVALNEILLYLITSMTYKTIEKSSSES
jgi:2-dehydropantoate 2-reductase